MKLLSHLFSYYFILTFLTLFIFLQATSAVTPECDSNKFNCDDGTCIALNALCDSFEDCDNGSDEHNCFNATCGPTESSCDNGQCIPQKWVCDEEIDCNDRSDENPKTCAERKCADDHFSCENGLCITVDWLCDGQNDCPNGLDEKDCVQDKCLPKEFRCSNGDCINSGWVCDGENDCADESDEKGCEPHTCQPDEFECDTHTCLNPSWICDGDKDCSDNADESNCTTINNECTSLDFICKNEICITKSWKCDGDEDCLDGSDEVNCTHTCDNDHFLCEESKECLHKLLKCDGSVDCESGSDEKDCGSSENTCTDRTFDCYGDKKKCIPWNKVCDFRNDCGNWQDENDDFCLEKYPCKDDNGGCQQQCISLRHMHRCDCFTGFKLVGNSTCQDVDECEIFGTCSQLCENHVGSYKCSCLQGYELHDRNSCKTVGPRPWLIVSNKADVRKLQLGTHKYKLIHSKSDNAIALDFDYAEGMVYWTDITQEKILRAPFDADDAVNSSETVIGTGLKHPDGLAVDWIHHNIYWTDTGLTKIFVANKSGHHVKTLIDQELREPRAIAVDPKRGWFYWTDWGYPASIQMCGMNGKYSRKIVVNIQWPNGLTIDYENQRLYWIDAKLRKIESSNLNGGQRITILSSRRYILFPFAITVFEDTLYWTDRNSESICQANKFTGEHFERLGLQLREPMDLHVYHHTRQPSSTSHCGPNNGGCAHLCLPDPRDDGHTTYSCVCADGYLSLRNGRECVRQEPYDIAANSSTVLTKSNVSLTSNTTTTTPIKINDSTTVTIPPPTTTSITTSHPIKENNTHIQPAAAVTNISTLSNDSGKAIQPVTNPSHTTTSKSQGIPPSTRSPVQSSTITPTTHGDNQSNSDSSITQVSTGNSLNQTTLVVIQKPKETGKITGIVTTVLILILIILIVITYVSYKAYRKKRTKHMNFDNPVYRKTTEDRIMLEKNTPNQLPATLQPLTA
ncbi:very low-density lipoprotein receptor isoform X1 [Octopus sinensis]|uniref:Very low-density lipoprotein receptor isoform X1 n=1 Tax=Octopus sinensis TaxID=2607531 RepID=A0A6P7T0D5_9MOLL|nr:very low-density lipoprotein receptor isoform X1 [Octopus sinensis]